MTESGPLLDRRAIEDAFRRLGDRLVPQGVIADIYVFGGTAMALADDARRATRRLGLSSIDQVLAVCAEVFPDKPVPERARLIIEDALEEVAGQSTED